jgi:hypothetical protein
LLLHPAHDSVAGRDNRFVPVGATQTKQHLMSVHFKDMQHGAEGRTSRIIVVEPSVLGQSHLLVNTGFIKLIASLYAEVIVLSEARHSLALASYVEKGGNAGNIQFVTYTKKRNLAQSISDLALSTGVEAVFFLNLEYSVFIKMNMTRVRRSGLEFYWVLHSHLISLNSSLLSSRIKNMLKCVALFGVFSDNTFIVCGESIRTNFLARSGRSRYANKIFPVLHPLGIAIEEAGQAGRIACPDRPASLVFLQGWHALSETLEALLGRISRVIERRDGVELEIVRNTFEKGCDGRLFSRSYGERIRRMIRSDYVLYCPEDKYALQASGSLMDLLVAKVPVIGLRTDFSRELEDKIGEIGFFFDSWDELVDFLATVDRDLLFARKSRFDANLDRAPKVVKEIGLRQLCRLGRAFQPARANASQSD